MVIIIIAVGEID